MGVVAGGAPDYAGAFDIEQLVRDSEVIFKANFNTEVTAINTLKSDSLISTVEDDAWFLNHIPKVQNYNPFITWGISDVRDVDSSEFGSMQAVKMFVEVVVTDNGDESASSVFYKLVRYMRVLKSLASQSLCDKFQGIVSTFKVTDSLPTSFSVDDGNMFRAAGIVIEFNFTTN